MGHDLTITTWDNVKGKQENKRWDLQQFGASEALAPREGLTNGICTKKQNMEFAKSSTWV